jgi:hypothetical protein
MTEQKGQAGQLPDWCTSKEAAEIVSANSGHQVSKAYIRKLGNEEKIRTLKLSQRVKLYNRSDVETYHVRQHFSREEKR